MAISNGKKKFCPKGALPGELECLSRRGSVDFEVTGRAIRRKFGKAITMKYLSRRVQTRSSTNPGFICMLLELDRPQFPCVLLENCRKGG